VLDTPAVLPPEVPDVDVLPKLLLTGIFNWFSSFLVFFYILS